MEPKGLNFSWPPKSEDEFNQEKQNAEAERVMTMASLEDELKKVNSSILELEKDRWVRVSLKILAEPVANKESSLSLGMRNSQAASEKAEKIAEAILKVTKSNRKTSLELKSLSDQLTLLNSYRKVGGNLSFRLSENEQESDLPAQQLNSILEWLRQPEAPSGQIVIDLPALSDAVRSVSRKYYNNTPICELPDLVRDQDFEATPGNLFNWIRIDKFLYSLSDDNARLVYLKKLKQKLLSRDQSGFIWIGEKKEFSGERDKNLHRRIEEELVIYDKISDLSPSKNSRRVGPSEFTTRRSILILLFITFGKLELPEDVTQERVVEFFHGLIGKDVKKIRDILKNPTAHKDGRRSIKLLCEDLNFTRDQVGKLGITMKTENIITEIEMMIAEIKSESLEIETDVDDLDY